MSEPDADPNPPPEQGLQDDVQHPPVGHDPTALIHDLANVVKDQQYFNAELLHATHGQLQSLTQTVESLSRRIIDLPPKSSDGLRLPNIQLPEYTGQENLDRFLLQLHGIFRASAIPAKHWLTYLKQQCQKDPRAYDALIEAESKYLRDDWSKASSDDYKHVYDECVKFLQLKRGKPKDQRIRELLSIYYTMKQQPNETVADFAHRFCEVQHELKLLIPNIHHTPDGNDLELIYAFSIKLKEDINRNLVSREFAFSCLQEVIHAAARYEDQSIVKSDSLTSDSTLSKSVDKPAALYADKSYHNNTRFRSDAQRDRPDKPPSYQKSGFSPDTFSRSKVPPNRPNSSFERSSSSSQVCYAFNRYPKANCELQNNKCQHGRQHKCLTCNRVGCKQLFHANSESPSRSSRPPNKSSNSANRNVPQRNSHVTISPGLSVLSGPIDLSKVVSSPQLGIVPPSSDHNQPKCNSSSSSEPPESFQPVLVSMSSDNASVFALPALQETFFTNVVIYSTQANVSLPINASLGVIRTAKLSDTLEFDSAVQYTSELLADSWFALATSQTSQSSAPSPPKVAPTTNSSSSSQDSSILSSFLPDPSVLHPDAFPPSTSPTLDPFSEQYFVQICKALELESELYSHLHPEIMANFKQLLRKFPHAFYLAGAPLTPIRGFHHNIDTGDSPPVHKLPYRKSPSELCAIKAELERMIKLGIVNESKSAWGSPCILVRKPLEKGKPQPPRFVVDYRGLNAITKGDGYPIPSVSNILDATSGGKYFGKLDLASGYWQILVNPEHVEKTTFTTHLGHHFFTRMPYGLKTAPQRFQRILKTVFFRVSLQVADNLYR